ncbi:ceramide glucosyltransferase [Rhizomicrobium palustre]|uniref:Ceramide glucosyltransferase n=1 Tax=Rhizomicrobium palustre TaxID=189966 RepID=A0A846N0B0_9PROT|nr:bacteriohopanetetrol glucosamine biosynthesis glycosyltransferase HpnI [Rhizomicrobium palustre]NIK88791.1 ceramide glucosyltransferase [Rhizomicrobium palustre]
MTVLPILSWLLILAAFAGAGYALVAAGFAGRFKASAIAPLTEYPSITILKPLHGDEPGLEENLASFFVQDYPAPFEIVFGVQDPNDAALAVVERLKARFPNINTITVVDGARAGTNPKVANLLNMEKAIRHQVIVLSDADIAVEADYLRRIASALAPEDVGGVTCLYTGFAAAGRVSQLSAMGASYQFLPNVIMGLGLKMAQPCFGSTIAFKRSLFESWGGFLPFKDQLADDHAMGMAVRNAGLILAIPPFAVRHAAVETGWGEWFTHELRWMRTIRTVDPGGHAGSFITHAFPLSLLGLIVALAAQSGPLDAAWGAVVATLLARVMLKWRLDAIFGKPAGPFWLLPFRDVFSFCVFLTSLFGGAVVWQNERLAVLKDGALKARS